MTCSLYKIIAFGHTKVVSPSWNDNICILLCLLSKKKMLKQFDL